MDRKTRRKLLVGFTATKQMVDEVSAALRALGKPPKPAETDEDRLGFVVRDSLPGLIEEGWSTDVIANVVAPTTATIDRDTLLAVISQVRDQMQADLKEQAAATKANPAAEPKVIRRPAKLNLPPLPQPANRTSQERPHDPEDEAQRQAEGNTTLSSRQHDHGGKQNTRTAVRDTEPNADAEQTKPERDGPAQAFIVSQPEPPPEDEPEMSVQADDHDLMAAEDEDTVELVEYATPAPASPAMSDTGGDTNRSAGNTRQSTHQGEQLDLIQKPEDKRSK